jgi:hypothetical protein
LSSVLFVYIFKDIGFSENTWYFQNPYFIAELIRIACPKSIWVSKFPKMFLRATSTDFLVVSRHYGTSK